MKEEKIKKFSVPEIPKYILGRKRKNGKVDKRFSKSILIQEEFINELSGVSKVIKGHIINPTQ